MVKNTKPWISWEWNIIFQQNKKILNLCLRWHILRSCRFAAEVTFNEKNIKKWGWKTKRPYNSDKNDSTYDCNIKYLTIKINSDDDLKTI